MSQPNTTSQKPSPPLHAERNFSTDTYLPRQTPSTSTAPTFTCRTPFSTSHLWSVSISEGSRSDLTLPRSLSFARARLPAGCGRVMTFALERFAIGLLLLLLPTPMRPPDLSSQMSVGSFVHTALVWR
jgi:hypothetical protein